MNDILLYILLTALSIGGFYIIYHLFFRAGHHFQFNRIFILLAILFSFAFPFLSVDLNQSAFEPINQFTTEELSPFFDDANAYVVENANKKPGSSFNPSYWLTAIYCLGVLLFIIRYGIKLVSILKLIRQNEIIKKDQYYYVKLKEGLPTFSFINYIFSDQAIVGPNNQAMFDHEKCHVDQRHSYDLLLIELLLTLQWFNPFIYLFKQRLVETHEYLADEGVLKQGHEKASYLKLLGSVTGIDFQHQFSSHFNSNMYKRIIMMKSNKSIKLKFWKLAFPLVFGLTIIIVHSGFKNESLPVLVSDVINTPDISLKKTPTFIQPIKKEDLGKITSGYGMRMHPVLKKEMMHNGVDFSAEKGVEIHATLKGVVRVADLKDNYGNMIIIDHEEGYSSRYSAMETMNVNTGDKVATGQVIGTVGSTGMSTAPHLHFEIMKDGKNVNPEDYLEPYQ